MPVVAQLEWGMSEAAPYVLANAVSLLLAFLCFFCAWTIFKKTAIVLGVLGLVAFIPMFLIHWDILRSWDYDVVQAAKPLFYHVTLGLFVTSPPVLAVFGIVVAVCRLVCSDRASAAAVAG